MVLNRRDELDIRVRTGFASFIAGFVSACLFLMVATDVL
jgi:tetrahydromethanopterin S-methyltransferase subunit F